MATPALAQTRTATLKRTATATRTRTVRPPTRTPTLRRTATPTRTRTLPRTATQTRPPTAPIATRTATATIRSEPTHTASAISSATPQRTSTSVPTATMAMEATATMMLPATSTATAVRTPSWTRPPEPSRSATATPTTGGGSGHTATPVPTTAADPLTVAYGRFLDQATFGHSPAAMARLAQIGIPAFLEEQLAMAESPWPAVATATRSAAIDAFFNNALAGPDQLRQRVLFALSEIIVEATNKNTNADEIVPWLRLLSRNAFGNYRTLLAEITLDGSMGKYLDLANSGRSGAPNENYPREVMQLFSLGVYKLNLDGSVQGDAQNVPIPTYGEADVKALARALTGWTWGNASGTPPTWFNSNYYPGPMLPVANYHDTTAKTLLGQTIPANQTHQQDLDRAIDIIFEHPNVGPFLATRLIRAIATSNPSPAYIARVAGRFNDNGAGVRGDMKAVIRGILLDPEARNDSPPSNFGRLRTPVQNLIALSRALGIAIGQPNQIAYLFTNMGESLLDAPSVFGHYSPSYRIPRTALFGPEFQIFSASDAVNRGNLFDLFYRSPYPINGALQPFVGIAGNHAALIDAVDRALLYGRMSAITRTALLEALPSQQDNYARVLTVVYLTSMSGDFMVQR